MGFFALVPVLQLIVGVAVLFAPPPANQQGEMPPSAVGWFFIIIASAFIILGVVIAALIFITGRFLSRRKNHTFCLVIAALECLFIPLGTILGVFTIIVLMRDSVKHLFATSQGLIAERLAGN